MCLFRIMFDKALVPYDFPFFLGDLSISHTTWPDLTEASLLLVCDS